MDFSTSVNALKVYSQCLKANGENLASAGAIAGRFKEILVTGSVSINNTTVAPQNQVFTLDQKPIRYIDQVGAPQASPEPLNFSIIGRGMVPVKDVSGNLGYCRNATFAMDKDKKLVNSLGQSLQVFKTDETGRILSNVNPKNPETLTTLNLKDQYIPPKASTKLDVVAELPVNSSGGNSMAWAMTVMDSTGHANTLDMHFTRTTVPDGIAGAYAWNVSLSDPNGLTTSINDAYKQVDNGDGTTAYGTTKVIFDGKGAILGYYDSSAGGTELSSTPPNLVLDWGNGSMQSDIAMNLGEIGSVQNMNVSAIDRPKNAKISANGYQAGEFSEFVITPDGYGVINYTNNQNLTYCRIPLSLFPDANSLEEVSPGVFRPNLYSGAADYFFPGEAGTGLLKTAHKEGSTIDSTDVYLKMIDDQANYISNIKAIEVKKDTFNRLIQST